MKAESEADPFGAFGYTRMIGRYSNSLLQGTDAEGRRWHFGGKANDSLGSFNGNATLAGGAGDDSLNLTGNANTVVYGRGDGADHVITGGTGNVLRLGPGITAADLKLGLGSLAIQVGEDANDTIHFDFFDASAVLARKPFDHIQFDDGSTLSYEALLAKGFDLTGTSGNDTIAGSNVTDRITGSAGNDTLSGGAGDDRYSFAMGDGQDRIIDTAGDDTVAFGPGLKAAEMMVAQHGDRGWRVESTAYLECQRPSPAASRQSAYCFGDMSFVGIEKNPIPHYPDIIAAPIRRNGERKQIARQTGHPPATQSRVENTPDTRQRAPGARGEGMHKSMIEAGNAVAGESRRWRRPEGSAEQGESTVAAANGNEWRWAA